MSRATRTKVKGDAVGRKSSMSKGGSVGKASEKLSPAGAKIVAAFEEAIEVMRLGKPLEKRFTIRTYRADFAPRDFGPDDIRRVRGLLGMSQAVFARFLGVDANTVRSWEQGTRSPSPIARRFLSEIEADPGYWQRRVAQSVTEGKPAS
jgi:putative transcriptional regulator